MHFDESFFEEEVREGFRVRPMMKRAWAAQLEVLEEVDRICKKHNIMYFAEWGTLLGAVRHHGFIPWDDDFDIGMKRKDYRRFVEVCRDELKPPFKLISFTNDVGFTELMSRLVAGEQMSVNEEFMNRFHGFPYRCGIDIFPNDNIPDGEKERAKFRELAATADALGCRWNDESMPMSEKKEFLDLLLQATNFKLSKDPSLTMAQKVLVLAEQISSMYADVETENIAQMDVFAANGYMIPKELLSTTIDMPFENTSIPVAIGYDRILKKKYGENYMTPVMGGGAHDYPFFKNHENFLYKTISDNGYEIPLHYRY